MSKYTLQLRELFEPIKFNPPLYTRSEIEAWFKDYDIEDYLTPLQIQVISEAGIWNKDKLARKIVDHYYMREIGLETPALFKHYAKVKMQEIMEEKLPLIYSSSIEYDPLINVDYKEIFERTADNTGTSNSNSNNSGSTLGVNSNTPQGQISKQGILQGDYASSTTATENESNITDETETTNNTTENYTKHIVGNSGVTASAQKMVELYRQNIRAIDKEIIKELNILFMGLY